MYKIALVIDSSNEFVEEHNLYAIPVKDLEKFSLDEINNVAICVADQDESDVAKKVGIFHRYLEKVSGSIFDPTKLNTEYVIDKVISTCLFY